jgi:hypothetical protein
MKRISICAAATAGLLIPAAALAAASVYKGGFDPSGKLKFKVASHHGKKVIPANRFRFTRFPLSCRTGDETTSGHLMAAIKVKRSRFHKRLFASDSGLDATLRLQGKLKHRGHRAVGTMRISGSDVPVDNGPPADCHSGEVPWKARRR